MVELITVALWIAVIYGTYNIITFLGSLFHRIFAGMLPRDLLTHYGKDSWAIVTGASDGIGEVFSKQLAKLGFNICLVSRTRSKLDRVEESLKQINPKIKTKIVVADLNQSISSPTLYSDIYEDIKDLDVSFLINSAGVYYVGLFEEIQEQKILNEINVNCFGTVFMTKTVLPLLLKHYENTGKKGAIINIASYAGLRPCPTSANYSASKALVNAFTKSIELGYREKLDIMSLCPMLVQSNMTRNRKTILAVSSEQCAISALHKIGRVTFTLGHWSHEVQHAIMEILPEFLSKRIQRNNLYQLLAAYNELDQKNAGASVEKKSQ